MSSPKVPALDNALRILSLLSSSRGPLPASTIAARLQIPRSSTYQILATLAEYGHAMHLPEEQRWGIGIASIELGSAYSRQEPIARLGRPLVSALADRLGMSGHLAILQGRDVVYVVEERAPGAPSLVTDVDVRLPAHSTASGRAILSAMPKAQVRALYPSNYQFSTMLDDSVDRYSQLRRILDEVINRGYALEEGLVTRGLTSISIPVLDHRDWPIASMTLTFPEAKIPEDRFEEIAAEVRDSASTLSMRLYHRDGAKNLSP